LAAPEGSELIAPFAVTPVDTTGAGDAFIGSFAVFLGAGLPEKEAVTRANLYAGMSTTKVGTQKSFPTGAEFAAEWAKRGGKA
jgi:ribokinase